MVQKRTVQKILSAEKCLRKHGYHIVNLILFGSRARNRQHRDSDIDLCVVAHHLGNRWHERLKMQKLLQPIDQQFDVFPCTPQEYRNNRLSPLLDQVRKTGVDLSSLTRK